MRALCSHVWLRTASTFASVFVCVCPEILFYWYRDDPRICYSFESTQIIASGAGPSLSLALEIKLCSFPDRISVLSHVRRAKPV